MTLRTYLALMIIASLVAWLGFGIVLLSVDPQTTSWIGVGLMYVSLIVAVTGTGSILGFIIRFLFLKHELIARSVLVAFRQGFLMAVLVAGILFLFSHSLFNALNVGLLIVALTALEFFLLSIETTTIKTE